MEPTRLSQMVTFLVLLICTSISARLAVMSVDLGGEFMKIALVKPGVPMEIVLNKESSRKTRTIVAFRDGERQFSSDAYTTAVKFPEKSYGYLTYLLGRLFDDPVVQQYRQRFPHYNDVMVKDEERGTVLFKVDDGTLYSPEELLGMLLDKAREYASDFAEQEVKDAVITVPAYFNQAERRAVKAAAELVGINVLQLMSDNAAVALNYGVFRRKNFNTTAQHYVFYDMGSSSTVATVVSYQLVKTKEGTQVETNPQLTIKGVGYDRSLGGLEMTLRLRNHLAEIFNSQIKTTKKIQSSPRAMAKLLKEAERVKLVLSANADHTAQVEGLFEEKDFHSKVTREDLENLNKDLLERVTKPLEEALKVSDITLDEISEIILMGGSTRIPKVQELLLKYTGRTDLGKSINTDEAAAMGAVYQAAYLGKGFKVKTFHVREAAIFPINVEFEKQKAVEDGAETARLIKRTLFARMNPFPQKKVMTFNKHFKDFSFDVRYGDLDFLSAEERKTFHTLLLSNISLVGVAEALSRQGEGTEYKGVKAHFRMDESGILSLDKVESVFEKKQEEVEPPGDESTWSKIGNAFGGLFGRTEGGKAEEGNVESFEQEGDKPEHADPNKIDKESNQSDQDKTGSDRSEQDQASSEQSEDLNSKPEKNTEQASEKKPTEDEHSDKADEEEKTTSGRKTASKDGKSDKEKKVVKDEEKRGKADAEKESTDTKEEKKDEKKPATIKIVTLKEDIKAEIEVKDILDLTKERIQEAKKRLSDLQKKDQEKAELQKAKNDIEGFIFDTQDKLSQDLYIKCSTQEEREHVLQQLSEASDWHYAQPDDAKKEVFVNKLKELKDQMKTINMRVYEKEERPKALAALKQHLNSTTVFLETVRNMTDADDPIFTEVELNTLEKLINETKEWRDSAVKEQKKLKDHENPILQVESIGLKIYALDREMKYLINKAKNFRPKPKTEKKDNTTAKGNDTADSDGEKVKSNEKEEVKEKEASKDADEDGEVTVEEEGDETTIMPESQEVPKTKSDPGEIEDTLKNPETDTKTKPEIPETDKNVKPDSKSQTSGKQRPKKKVEQGKDNSEQEDILELESDSKEKDSQTESPHVEL